MTAPRAGRVRLDGTAFVAPGAVVIGEVAIGPRSSVWFNTVMRGDVAEIEVGEASNLQDNSTVHVDAGQPVRIGNRVTVGHRAIVHGCVIEDDCLIGMGSVLLTGCRIGTGSFVGAASLVLEGMQIPPGSVVLGSPARVTGQVNERHREGIRHGSVTYSELAESCMRRGYARAVGRDGEIARDRAQMTHTEWTTLLRALDFAPRWMFQLLQNWRDRGGAPPENHILDTLAGSVWMDGEVRRPCLERLLQGEEAWQEAPAAKPRSLEPADFEPLYRQWLEHRAALFARLTPLGPTDWWRIVRHPTRGPLTLAELIRDWSEEDMDLWQWFVAAGEQA